VLGNHDWLNDGERIRRALLEAGIEVLENDAVSLEFGGEVIWVVGLADAAARSPDLETPFALVPEGAPLVVLSHNPDVFPDLPSRPAFVLSGHTHGAQVNVPAVRERITPSRYGARYTGGLFRKEGSVMYSSTGIGTSTVPARFRAPPEIAVVELSGSVR
jgi:predicted MPP superfamily phosphohydrolase